MKRKVSKNSRKCFLFAEKINNEDRPEKFFMKQAVNVALVEELCWQMQPGSALQGMLYQLLVLQLWFAAPVLTAYSSAACSLFLVPGSLFLVPCSLFLVPCFCAA